VLVAGVQLYSAARLGRGPGHASMVVVAVVWIDMARRQRGRSFLRADAGSRSLVTGHRLQVSAQRLLQSTDCK